MTSPAALLIGLLLTLASALCAAFYAYRAAHAATPGERWAWLCAMAWAMGAALNQKFSGGTSAATRG